jgi:ISXO2-like transposase domain
MAAHIVLPWVHRIFSNLKVWALGVYHGLRRKHLQSYLDEFVFRFNRPTCTVEIDSGVFGWDRSTLILLFQQTTN